MGSSNHFSDYNIFVSNFFEFVMDTLIIIVKSLVLSLFALLLTLMLVPINVIVVLLTTNKEGRTRGYKIFIALDQLYAVIIFGREDITISSLLYYFHKIEGKSGYFYAIKFVDTLAYLIAKQKNHCKESYLNEISQFHNYNEIYINERRNV